ncbi:MAG TPA: hypothetical protein VGM90_17585 [Kofleriaceae bacterium]|jgi:hypothetical protein
MDALARVLADPASNAARRQLAEAGDPRAALIRAQLAVWDEDRAGRMGSRAYNKALGEANALADAHHWDWSGKVADYTQEFKFHRGLVAEVTIACDKLVDIFEELCKQAPIQHLKVRGPFGGWPQLVAHPRFAQIVSVDVSKQKDFGDRELIELAKSARSTNLRWLGLLQTTVGRAGMEALAASPHLANLVRVYYEGDYNPTPAYSDIDGFFQVTPSLAGKELEKAFGPRLWLNPPDDKIDQWRALADQHAAT